MARTRSGLVLTLALAALVALGACKKKPPVARPTPPPPPSSTDAGTPPVPPEPAPEPSAVPPEPSVEGAALGTADYSNMSLEEINKESPLVPVFYIYDSAELSGEAQTSLQESAALLKEYPGWIITIEGHCDERGTPEYNLALGERRALAARNYLASLGVAAERMKTVSYGKEFPFDPGHDEAAWAKNRRAHFVVTSK